MILDDLEIGVLPLYERELSAQEAWDVSYRDAPEFALVDFELFQKGSRITKNRIGHCTQDLKMAVMAALYLIFQQQTNC
eukprot:15359544-Ditylum_brightwellii.AAC.1